jgi:hypothetical protein
MIIKINIRKNILNKRININIKKQKELFQKNFFIRQNLNNQIKKYKISDNF